VSETESELGLSRRVTPECDGRAAGGAEAASEKLSVDEGPVGDGSQHAAMTSTEAAGEDVEGEGFPKQRGPVEARPPRSPRRRFHREGQAGLGLRRWRRATKANDGATVCGVWSEDAVKVDEVLARGRADGGQFLQQLQGREHHHLPAAHGLLHAVLVQAVVTASETRGGDGTACAVPAEALEADGVIGVDPSVSVHGDAVSDGDSAVVRASGSLRGSAQVEGLLKGLHAECVEAVIELGVSVIEAAAVQRLRDATCEASHQRGDFLRSRRLELHEVEVADSLQEDTVRHEGVEVRRELKGAAPVLHLRHRARQHRGGDSVFSRPAALPGGEESGQVTKHLFEEALLFHQAPSERVREGDGPLTVGHFRQHRRHEVRAGVMGSARATGGAEAAAFA
jgi:hypothetical protein